MTIPLKKHDQERTIMIGGGPAGLTAAYQLCKAGLPCLVLEKDAVVGGLSRTVDYKGYLFDIGGHRFFTKISRVNKMWEEVLSDKDFIVRRRLSRIYYDNKFFHYPLRPMNALLGLGIFNSIWILLSYVYAQCFPDKPEKTFEQWVSNRFGKRLYSIFFKAYTEKVWGIPCNEISADWAAQRIKGLSLLAALKQALLEKQTDKKGEVIKTLIDRFQYPRLGPGMMWEQVAGIVDNNGGQVQLEAEVEKIIWRPDRVTAVQVKKGNEVEMVEGSHFISSMPVRELIQRFEPTVPQDVLDAANDLQYRDFLIVALIVSRSEMFPDNWIYIHDPDVKVGRIQNFKNWSPDMVCDPDKTCLGLEYFCNEGDGLWAIPASPWRSCPFMSFPTSFIRNG